MQIARRTLFDNGLWRIGHVSVRYPPQLPGDIELQREHILVLPMAGVFAKHDSSRRHIVGTPNHAIVIGAERPYRLSYPAGIGDRCLTVRFSDDTLSQLLQKTVRQGLASTIFAARPLLPAQLMLMRNLLWRRFQSDQWDAMEVEELGGTLLEATLRLVQVDGEQSCRPRLSRQRAAIEAVKEAVAVHPAHKWSLGDLAKIGNVSPFHLSRIFRQGAGTSAYQYVLRARLAAALHALTETNMDLTAIGLDTGFSNHSHFTARFHSFFGMTPTAFRRVGKAAMAAEVRRIVTALRDRSC